jgi:hypothetical protein
MTIQMRVTAPAPSALKMTPSPSSRTRMNLESPSEWRSNSQPDRQWLDRINVRCPLGRDATEDRSRHHSQAAICVAGSAAVAA